MALQFEIRYLLYELKRPDCFHGCNGKVFWMKFVFGKTPQTELWGRKPVAEFPAPSMAELILVMFAMLALISGCKAHCAPN